MNFKRISLLLSIVFLTNSINCGFEQIINLLKNNKKAAVCSVLALSAIVYLIKLKASAPVSAQEAEANALAAEREEEEYNQFHGIAMR